MQFPLFCLWPSREPGRPESPSVSRESHLRPILVRHTRCATRTVNDPSAALPQEQTAAALAILQLNLLFATLTLIYEIHNVASRLGISSRKTKKPWRRLLGPGLVYLTMTCLDYVIRIASSYWSLVLASEAICRKYPSSYPDLRTRPFWTRMHKRPVKWRPRSNCSVDAERTSADLTLRRNSAKLRSSS